MLYRDKVWFTYHKGWQPGLIDSWMFDNPAAFSNPSRNPAPTADLYPEADGVDLAGGALGARGLRMDLADVIPALGPWETLPVTREDVAGLGAAALAAGFHEADFTHYYSRVPQDGWNNPVVQAAAAWLVDGVVDASALARGSGLEALLDGAGLGWITRGTCNAGDIRARIDARRLPASVSVIAEQAAPNRLREHVYASGRAAVFVRAGRHSRESLAAAVLRESASWVWGWRAAVAALALAPAAFAAAELRADVVKSAAPEGGADAAHAALAALLAGAIFSAALGLVTLVLYGLAECGAAALGAAGFGAAAGLLLWWEASATKKTAKEL